eukprot:TRINITY_DN41942_c0_g1_i1.p1 TRINITY_DN41942_c0_g1~~TRINITY_DN41942_c0_g1_i1.p1  ORF type:complete len:291 (-),score=42.11 TRINITY_DN41942_c0_g1_i1:304-1176(-)
MHETFVLIHYWPLPSRPTTSASMRSNGVQALSACSILVVAAGVTKNDYSGCASCTSNATWVRPANDPYGEKSDQTSYDAAVGHSPAARHSSGARASGALSLPPPEPSVNRIQAALTGGIQQLVQEVEGIASRTGFLHEQVQDLTGRITTQDKELLAQSGQVQDLINQMVETDKQAKIHSERIAAADEQIGSLSSRMAAKDKQVAGQVQQIKILFDLMDAKDQQIAGQDEQILGLTNQTSMLKQQLTAMVTEVQQLRILTEHTKHRGDQFMMYTPLALLVLLVPTLCCIAG